jgi:hypothetical protein
MKGMGVKKETENCRRRQSESWETENENQAPGTALVMQATHELNSFFMRNDNACKRRALHRVGA